jgi:hypothetical protein
MHESDKRAGFVRVLVLGLLWATAAMSWSIELPAGPLLRLKSEEFSKREVAQAELLVWARGHVEPAMDALYRHTRVADDPEVRDRCLAVLRELVHDEYLKQGEGYLGIRMLDEFAKVPGDLELRSVIRVIQVVPDSAAQHAGLQMNDLIAALGDQVWRKDPASRMFTEKIRQLKPNTRIQLKVLRDGKLLEMGLTLARRPLIADSLFLDARQVDLEAVERVAKEAYFRRWLEGRKLGR